MSDYVVYNSEQCEKCKGRGVIDRNIICYPCSGRGRTYKMVNLQDVLLEMLKKLRWTVSGDATEVQQWGKFEDLELEDDRNGIA